MKRRTAPTEYAVILLGDQDTGDRADVLAAKAAEHHAVIAEIHTFDPHQARSQEQLVDVDGVVTALSRAVATMTPIWVPFPLEDFGREHHLRRISLVLQRHRTNLLLGQHLWPCPADGGVNEIDLALRREVHAVDELNHAVLAAAAFTALGLDYEIEKALAATAPEQGQPASPLVRRPARVVEPTDGHGTGDGAGPELPSPSMSWPQRHAHLKAYVTWLVQECGLSQAGAAEHINAAGHRTPQGRPWQQATISALINGRYTRGAAA